jgi:cell wall-associated NlpC family hydrolase
MMASTKKQTSIEEKNTSSNNHRDVKSQDQEEEDPQERDDGGASPEQRAAVAAKLCHAQLGDILIFHNARKWNRLITWLTRSRYYHVGIYAGDYHVVEARPRGVVCRDLNGPDGDRHFDVIPAPEGKGAAALAWARAQLGADYDKSDALAIALQQLFNLRCVCLGRFSQGEYSCGEFVTKAYREAKVPLFPGQDPHLVVPANFEPMVPVKENLK